MTKKKSILIVAIIAVLVVAISGVSFAAWQAFIKPADQTWTVTANTPGTLTVTKGAITNPNYNGEKGTINDKYQTSCILTMTSTVTMTVKPTVVLFVTTVGGVEQAAPLGSTVSLSNTSLTADVLTEINCTVGFPDLSDTMYYGATFRIVVTLDKA